MTMSTTEQARQKAIEAEQIKSLVSGAEKSIAHLEEQAHQGNGGLVTVRARQILERLADPRIPMEVRRRCSDKLKVIQREAYEKDVDTILEHAITEARGGDQGRKKDMMRKGRDAFVAAMRLGSGEEFKRLVRMKMDIIMTTTGHGQSEGAKRDIDEPDTGHEPTEKEKMRRFIRFRDPVLLVAINGSNKYETIDWSLAGLRVRDYPKAIRVGTPLPITVTLEEGGKLAIPLNAVVVRYNPTGGKLGVKFTSPTSAMLPLMKRLQELEIEPAPL